MARPNSKIKHCFGDAKHHHHALSCCSLLCTSCKQQACRLVPIGRVLTLVYIKCLCSKSHPHYVVPEEQFYCLWSMRLQLIMHSDLHLLPWLLAQQMTFHVECTDCDSNIKHIKNILIVHNNVLDALIVIQIYHIYWNADIPPVDVK